MKRTRILLSLLVGAQVLVYFAPLALSPVLRADPPLEVYIAFDGLLLAVGNLLAIWAILPARSCWRFTALLAAIQVAIWTLRGVDERADELSLPDWLVELVHYPVCDECVNSLLGQVMAASLPLFVARIAGLTLSHLPRERGLRGRTVTRPKLQFSIRFMLEFTVVIALLLVSARCHYGTWSHTFHAQPWLHFALFGKSTLIAGAALWVALGTNRFALRLVVFLLAASCLGWDWEERTLLVPQTAWMVASLGVVRLAGYRLACNAEAKQ